MIIIVDNGKGYDVASMITAKKKLITPDEIKAEEKNASGWIISDGTPENSKPCIELIQRAKKPLLGVGIGAIYLAAAFGGEVTETKPKKQEVRIKINISCPLTNDLKKTFPIVKNNRFNIEGLPDCFDIPASSPDNAEIIADSENPFFGLNFAPELGGEGIRIVKNFQKFVEVWGKYH